jgi:UDP-glucose 4-epimerase
LRILITGGFGFIGGRLAVYLASAGHEIVIATRNFNIPPKWLPEAKVVKITWNDDKALELTCSGVDVIIHAAGINAQDCLANPEAALAFNGLTTGRLVQAAIKTSVKKFIYLSTAHVYKSPLNGVITEETCPTNLHPYATSHIKGEQAVLSANKYKEFQGIVLRISNAFGAPAFKEVNCWMLLVNDLCKQAVEKRKLFLQTNGQQQRDFIGLTEVCKTIEYFVNNYIGSNQAEIFNLGSGMSQSVISMAQLIQQQCYKVLGFKPELNCKENKIDQQQPHLIYVSNKLKELGFIYQKKDETEEIDSLLKFCEIAFAGKQ